MGEFVVNKVAVEQILLKSPSVFHCQSSFIHQCSVLTEVCDRLVTIWVLRCGFTYEQALGLVQSKAVSTVFLKTLVVSCELRNRREMWFHNTRRFACGSKFETVTQIIRKDIFFISPNNHKRMRMLQSYIGLD